MNENDSDLRKIEPVVKSPVLGRRACLFATGAWVATALAGCAAVERPAGRPTSPLTPEPTAVTLTRPPRVGLALGGGAARGFAHVGVIEVLEKQCIRPHCVVGTSAGSLVAALYASGKNHAELLRAAMAMEEAVLTDWTLPFANRGLLKGLALARYVNQQVGNRLLEQMPMPLGILATDLANGEGVLFQRGDTGTAVRASSAVPGIFQPVEIAGREYVDGGLVAPVPVHHAVQMGAELVIAVDISSAPDAQAATDSLRVMLQSFSIMGQTINRFELQSAHVVVRPKLSGVGSAAFSERQRSMAAGREAMLDALPALKAQLLKRAVPVSRG